MLSGSDTAVLEEPASGSLCETGGVLSEAGLDEEVETDTMGRAVLGCCVFSGWTGVTGTLEKAGRWGIPGKRSRCNCR